MQKQNKGKLIRSLSILSVTVILLAGVTVAWFVNNASPILGKLNFASMDLNVEVDIRGETGKTSVDESGNAILLAEYMKPGDSVDYYVTVTNQGDSPCRVYLGIDKVKDYNLDGTALGDGDKRLSDFIRVSLWNTQDSPGSDPANEVEAKFLKGVDSLYFDHILKLQPDQVVKYTYKVQFVGTKQQGEGQSLTGEIPKNEYTQKRMEAAFAVTSTLAN